MDDAINLRLNAIPWAEFSTAYGSALKVPDQLRRLASREEQTSLAASHELWCGLCHQHAYVSSAALPALPFILDVLNRAGDKLTIEILDIIFGFACCTKPSGEPIQPKWIDELRSRVVAERPRFKALATHQNHELADFAQRILSELAESANADG